MNLMDHAAITKNVARLRPLTILYRLVIYDCQINASYALTSIDSYEMDRVAIKKEYATMLDRL